MVHSESVNKRRLAVRLRYLTSLWQRLGELEPLPQLDRWLKAEFRTQRSFGKRDRQWYSDMIFGAIRFAPLVVLLAEVDENVASLEDALQAFAERYPRPSSLRTALFRIPVEKTLSIVAMRTAAPIATAASLPDGTTTHHELAYRLATHQRSPLARLIWNGIPLWFAERLVCRFERCGWDESTRERFVNMQATRPPLHLRLNHPDHAGAVLQELQQRGWQPRRHDRSVTLTVDDTAVLNTEAYRRGAVEIQDLASQMIGADVEAAAGQRVWDCCCGGGGKTVRIAAAMQGNGTILASDKRRHVLGETQARLSRAGIRGVTVLAWDATRPLSQAGIGIPPDGFDWVLVDAPCSGSGTWRRNPDLRLRIDTHELTRLTSLQTRLLETAAQQVTVGGHLVYATCSWLCEENEDITAEFLARHGEFSLRKETLHGCPEHDADTTYAAVMERMSLQ